MKRIENVTIVGMGALGLLFGQKISENLGDDARAVVPCIFKEMLTVAVIL